MMSDPRILLDDSEWLKLRTSLREDTVLSRTARKETKKDVEEAVEHDFGRHCRIAKTKDFLENLLPVDENLIKGTLSKMQDTGDYADGRWSCFPTPESHQKEVAVGAAWTEISNKIHKAVEEQVGLTEDNMYLGATEWVDSHSTTPTTEDKDAAPIRPDSVSASLFLKVWVLLKNFFLESANDIPQPEDQGSKKGKMAEGSKTGASKKVCFSFPRHSEQRILATSFVAAGSCCS